MRTTCKALAGLPLALFFGAVTATSPITVAQADNSGSAIIQPTGAPSSDLPQVGGSSARSASSPSSAPGDLTGLSQQVTKSVVTVICATGNDLGSGWSAGVNFTPSMRAAGYHSYIITNLHVVAACTSDPSIQMRLSNGDIITGKVWAWSDTDHDVAGIVTDAYVPPLTWRGDVPVQGWWVGVIGSPLGHPGVLTTGIVSSVTLPNGDTSSSLPYSGTTTAPINHGNSGGPVFDRSGRVLGLATAIFSDAQNFGIFNGTPILCDGVINCPSQSVVWGNGQMTGNGFGNLWIFLGLGTLLIAGFIALMVIAVKRNNKDRVKGTRPQNIYGVSTSYGVPSQPNRPAPGISSLGVPGVPPPPPPPPGTRGF